MAKRQDAQTFIMRASPLLMKGHAVKATLLTLSVLASMWMAVFSAPAWAQKKQVSCKLQSEKIVQGREKQCLYVCPDKSLEGRTRKKDADCPQFITTTLR